MGTHRVELGDGPRDVPVVAVPRAAYRRLEVAHGDEDEFAVHLIAASTGLTVDEAHEAWDETPTVDAHALLDACVTASAPRDLAWAQAVLARDARLGDELAFCRAVGISWDEFLTWSDDAQDLALAEHLTSRDHCPGCGAPGPAMNDPEAAHLTSRMCVHCQAKDAATRDMPDAQRPYTYVFVVPGRS